MHLYYNELSPYCRKLLYFLEESEIPLELKRVDFPSLEFEALGFAELSPTGQIPALKTDRGVLSDSTVVMRYLCDLYMKTDLYPNGLYERAEVDLWTEYVNQHVGRHILTLSWQRHWTARLKKASNQEAIKQSELALAKYLPALDRRLKGRNFLTGTTLTMSDINLMGFLMEKAHAEMDLTQWPHLAQWFDRIVSRPKFTDFCARFSLK